MCLNGPVKGEMTLVSGNKDEHPSDMLEVEVVTKNTKQNIQLMGSALQISAPKVFSQDGLNFQTELWFKTVSGSVFDKVERFSIRALSRINES